MVDLLRPAGKPNSLRLHPGIQRTSSAILRCTKQLKYLTGSSCVLEISAGQNSGAVFFEKGNIIHVSTPDLEGTTALAAIFGWQASHFEVHPWREPEVRSIRERWESLLLDASRLADEAKQHAMGKQAVLAFEGRRLAAAVVSP